MVNASKSGQPLRGIIVPMATPLAAQEKLDMSGLERLIEYLLAGGVSGIFVLGTTGEGPSLSYKLRRELIERTCKLVNQRIAVLVGITDTSPAEAIALGKWATDAGATGIVAAPPYYLPLTQEELLGYFKKITEEVDLPLYLYNQPGNTKIDIEPATAARAATWEKVAGVKDSSKNMVNFQELRRMLKDRSDFSLFMGPDGLMAEAVLMGADGGVNAGANIHPKLYVELYEAARAKDMEKVTLLQDKVLKIITTVYRTGKSKLAHLKGIKCALNLMGLCSDLTAEPLVGLNDSEREQIRMHLIELGLSVK